MNEAWGAVVAGVAAAIGGLLGGWITARSAVNQALTEGREQQRNWLLDQRLAAYTELLDAYDGVKKRLQDLITAQEDPFIDDNDPPSREIVQATGMLYESRERLALAMRRIDLVGPRSAMQPAVEAITLAVEAAFRTRLNYSVANHTDEERTDWLRTLESVTATQIMFVEVANQVLHSNDL
ncbi:hypothetical protein ACF1FE_26140 [Streptomyces griseofuscus]|uniref:hypothetical protein n=1 Tax=Streptomyces griseofuscus TaxID=146922 RepID=UPI0036FB76E2